MTISVQIKSVYGSEKVYPACEKAKLFCEMLETRTLTSHAINKIKDLGYTINVVTAHQTTL